MQVDFSILLSFFPYAFLTAYTPGPANLVSLHTVGTYGWKGARSLLLGIACGFLLQMLICVAACMELAQILPKAAHYLRYVGVFYLLYLAGHILFQKGNAAQTTAASGFVTGFLLQITNVKVLLYALTVYTGYVLPHSDAWQLLFAAALCNTAIGMSGISFWGAAGGLLQKQLHAHDKAFRIMMTLGLLWCAWQIL